MHAERVYGACETRDLFFGRVPYNLSRDRLLLSRIGYLIKQSVI